SEAARLYRDKARGRKFTLAELKVIAAAVTADMSFQKRDGYALSAGEVFGLLNKFVAERGAGREAASLELKGTPYGPSNPVATLTEPVTTDWSQLARTAVDVADYLRKQGRVPTSVWLGSTAVPPESYLGALAQVTVDLLDGK